MTPMTLQASAWNEAAKPKSLPEGLYNKIADNQNLLQKILQLSQSEVENTINAFKNPTELEQVLRALVNRGFIITDQNNEDLTKFKQNLADVFEIGLNTGTTTPSAATSIVQTTMVDSVMQLVTQMDTDLKTQVGKILADGYSQKKFPVDIVKQMSNEIGISQSRAKKIATTETMRGSNAASWAQNHSGGAKYFVVDHRAAACKDCIKHFSGRVFKITETKYIPPIHPFCACVPIYFTTKAEAQSYAKKIKKRNNLERKELEKQGYKLPKDGTGPNLTGKEQAKIIKQVEKEPLKTSKTKAPTQSFTKPTKPVTAKTKPKTSKPIKPDETYDKALFDANGKLESMKVNVYNKGTKDELKIAKPAKAIKGAQKITYNDIIKRYNQMPPKLRESVKEVHLLDVANKEDAFRSQLTGKNFTTFGTGDSEKGIVTFYKNDTLKNPKKYLKDRALAHESAHLLDVKKYSTNKNWISAMNKEGYSSEYAKSTANTLNTKRGQMEDFADSVAFYSASLITQANFVEKFPLKAKVLKSILGG